MAIFDPLARVNRLIGAPPIARQASPTISLTPDQEQSLVGRVGNSALGGISAVGNLLDLVDLGSSIRDVLAGENPFDQFLTPFSSENRTTGRQLLRKHGLIGQQDTTANFWGGLGTELLLSPASYLGFGSGAIAKGTGGAVAKAAGLLPDAAKALAAKTGRLVSKVGPAEARVATTLRDVIQQGGMQAARKAAKAAKTQGVKLAKVADQPLGGLASVGLPFMEPLATLGTGARAQKIARGMDTAARAVKFAKIPGTDFQPVNSLARLFDSTLMGAKTAIGQTAARQLFRTREGARAKIGTTVSKFADDMVKAGWADPAQADKFRAMLEKVTATAPELHPVVDEITGSLASKFADLNRRGISTKKYLDQAMEHFPRYLAETSRRFSGRTNQIFSAGIPSRIGRKRFLFGIQGGTEAIKKIAKDPDLNQLIDGGGTLKELGEAVKRKYSSIIPAKFTMKEGGKQRDTAKAIANWLRSLSTETRAAGVFGNHPLWDFKSYMEHADDAIGAIDTVIDTLAQPGILKGASQAARTEGTVTLGWLGRRLKVNKGDATQGFAQELMRKMGMGPLLDNPDTAQGIIDSVSKYRLPKDLAEDLLRFRKGMDAPEAANEIVKAIDSVTNLFKATVTSLFPSFHSRNLVSGQFQNLIAGTFSVRSVRDAAKMLRGGVVTGAKDIPEIKTLARARGIKNLDDETATQLLGQLAAGHKVIGKFEGEAASTVGSQAAGSTLQDLVTAMPGRVPVTAGRIAKRAVAMTPETTWNPLATRGVGGRLETGFGPLAAGQDVGYLVEGLNRLSPFIHQLRKGVDAAEAAARVGAAQVQYGAKYYTKFEQQLMSRAFPFYKFCVSDDTEILTREGWKTFDQLRIGEEVLGYHHDTGEMQWEPLEAVNVFDHNGPINRQRSSRKRRVTEWLFTEGHRWPVFVRRRVLVGRKRARVSKREVRVAIDLTCDDSVPTAGEYRSLETCLSPRHAAILGWIITDGHFRIREKNGRQYASAVIYQSPKKHLAEIVELTGSTPQKPHFESGVCAVNVKAVDLAILTEHLTNKESLPKIACHLSRESAESMWDAMFKAEGTQYDTGRQMFYQQDPVVREVFQILCQLTGRSANICPSGCTVRRSRGYKIGANRDRVYYKGKVWCPTTPSGFWVARRNGSVIITGNSKGQIPFTLKQLIEHPGGRLAATIRGLNRSRKPDELTPDYVAETASIPLGQQQDGSNRYMTGLGLMFEDPLQFAPLMAGDVRGAGLEALSRLNPLLKGPLEWASGESFFQKGPMGGRDIADMDPTIGRTLANITGREKAVTFPGSQAMEFAAGNSPLARVLTTTRQLTDPRKDLLTKGINFGTGARITDVSPGSQDAILRERAAAMMKSLGAQSFYRTYFPAEEIATLPPEQQIEALRLQALMNTLAKRAKERKREASKPQLFGD